LRGRVARNGSAFSKARCPALRAPGRAQPAGRSIPGDTRTGRICPGGRRRPFDGPGAVGGSDPGRRIWADGRGGRRFSAFKSGFIGTDLARRDRNRADRPRTGRKRISGFLIGRARGGMGLNTSALAQTSRRDADALVRKPPAGHHFSFIEGRAREPGGRCGSRSASTSAKTGGPDRRLYGHRPGRDALLKFGTPEDRLDIRLLGLHCDIAETPGFGSAQGDPGDLAVLELVLVDDRHRVRSTRIVTSVVAIVKVIVDENAGVVIPAERTPAAVVIAPVPIYPGRTPGLMRNPVPAQAEPPTPAAVMVNGPTPRFRGDPGPTA